LIFFQMIIYHSGTDFVAFELNLHKIIENLLMNRIKKLFEHKQKLNLYLVK
jgi:hypothetical protein